MFGVSGTCQHRSHQWASGPGRVYQGLVRRGAVCPHEGPRAVKEGYQLALSLERCSCSSSQARATWYSVVRM
jgi:hypothetical protein